MTTPTNWHSPPFSSSQAEGVRTSIRGEMWSIYLRCIVEMGGVHDEV